MALLKELAGASHRPCLGHYSSRVTSCASTASSLGLNPAAALAILQLTSKDLGASGWDQEYGAGLVDAQAAVALAQNSLRAPTDSLTVKLRRGGTLVAEGRANATGLFGFDNLTAGEYTLEVGTDIDGDGILGEGGELYGAAQVSVSYAGDATQNVLVAPR